MQKEKREETGSTAANAQDKSNKDKSEDLMLMANENTSTSLDQDMWLGDSGASYHRTNNLKGMVDLKTIDSKITIGNGKQLTSTKMGNKRVTVIHKNGTKTNVTLTNVKYVPELWVNLFSFTTAMKQGFVMNGDMNGIKIKKGKAEIHFDRKIQNKTSVLFGIIMVPQNDESAHLSTNKTMEMSDFHSLMGHVGKTYLRKTAI